MLESEEEVGGEPRPLSVLLPVFGGVSPVAAVIDMIRSSSGRKRNADRCLETRVYSIYTALVKFAKFPHCAIVVAS